MTRTSAASWTELGEAMRWTAVICIGFLAPLTGCNLVHYAGHNLIREPVDRVNEEKLSHRLNAEARMAWQEVCRQHAARTFSHAFADGFKEGYADYLQNGGLPLPPAVPPPRYRSHPQAFSPEGHAAARDYLIGFKYGAEVACSTGRREFLTVPVLLPNDPPTEAPIQLVKLPAPPESVGDPAGMPLPAPRTKPMTLPSKHPTPTPDPIPVSPVPPGPTRPEPTPLPPATNPPAAPSPKSTPLPPLPPMPGVPIPYVPEAPLALPPVPTPLVPTGGTQPVDRTPEKLFGYPPLSIPPVMEAPPPLPPAPSPG